MKVTLREKKLKHGKRSLYLDYYPPTTIDGKTSRREFLSLYIYERPKNDIEREHNRETRLLGENVRSKRQLELQSNRHGFISKGKRTGDFLKFFAEIVDQKKTAALSTLQIWKNIFNHFTDYCGGVCTFAQIDTQFIEGFRDYLLAGTRRRSDSYKLSQNTAKAYFDRFRSVIKAAYEKKYLPDNPLIGIKIIKARDTRREFLTLEELRKLSTTKCQGVPEYFRRAALFSALTGLRFSDIEKLTWREVEENAEGKAFLNFQMKKTGGQLFLPISEEARELLGMRGASDEKVFPALKYSNMTTIQLGRWLIAAGIGKKLSFHDLRRTYATLQLSEGTDFFVVSKMLGHRDIRQTEIYARVLDKAKIETTNKIKLK